jgi:hypothetical protein
MFKKLVPVLGALLVAGSLAVAPVAAVAAPVTPPHHVVKKAMHKAWAHKGAMQKKWAHKKSWAHKKWTRKESAMHKKWASKKKAMKHTMMKKKPG